jgi:hypothetical protein
MAKISFAGWKDPVRRPRYLIWTGVAILGIAAVMIAALGVTSGYFFCGSFCHSIQLDAVKAYDNGSHNMVACTSCHMPVNGDPVTFLIHKVEAGVLGAWQLATKTYNSPLNPTSHLALNAGHMGEDICMSCHSENRVFTPSEGIIIDHDVHSENHIHCTACHNRVAHPEADVEIIAKNPKTGEIAAKHADFMTMTACFRCHTLTGESASGEEYEAPGTCATCHPADFELKPANHKAAGFYPEGHADLAVMEVDHVTGRPAENITRPVVYGEEEESHETTGAEEAEAESHEDEDPHVLHLAAVEDVDYCGTCHVKETFCGGCHGMEMPHPEEFKTKTHPEVAATKIDKCELCHQQSTTFFCDSCHHGTKVDWTFDTAVAWQTQHAKAVVEQGVTGCFGECHEQAFCVDCHTKMQPLPSSHKAADWLHKGLTVTTYPSTAAVASASHAVNAQKSIESCDVCHGPGGIGADFCKGCHQIEMPHPDTFKTNHVSGRNTPELCSNCHQQKELCSDCHHEGAKNGTPWQKQHPVTVAASGASGCFEACHESKAFCVDCHTKLSAVPTSHTARDWTHRVAADQPAKHQVTYKAATDSCDYCHGDGGVEAAFCANCHKLEMPHPAGFDSAHKADFEANKYTKAVCTNCHTQFMCDSCHHTGAVANQPWRTYHPNLVKKDGAEPCFECHEPTYCSYCHVRL